MTSHDENAILYHYGELDAPQAAEFETHLKNCAQCRAQLQSLASMGRVLRTSEPPAVAVENIRSAVLGRVPVAQFLFGLLRPAMVVASVLLIALAVHVAQKGGRVVDNPVQASWDDDFETIQTSVAEEVAMNFHSGAANGLDYHLSALEDLGDHANQYISI